MAGRRARSASRSRSRSQHFLRTQLAAELVRDAGIGAGDVVLDLDAGSGRLTTELAQRARHVVAIEIDPRLAPPPTRTMANVEVIEADAASVALPSSSFRVVANPPFDRTTDLFRHLLDDPRTPLVRADMVVEWQVAVKRAVPWPSTLNGVLWGAWYRFTLVRRLPRAAFEPPPAVDAGVLAIERRRDPLVDIDVWNGYRSFVALGFRRGLRGRTGRAATETPLRRPAATRPRRSPMGTSLSTDQGDATAFRPVRSRRPA